MGTKNIGAMLRIVKGSITDKSKWENGHIDTIVNAAKPTLMGSSQGVDNAIHEAVDRILAGNGTFNSHICEEFKVSESDGQILCERGRAVTSKGYGFCDWVIHAVGSKYDGSVDSNGEVIRKKECTSSCIDKLESCYLNIIKEVRKHPDIEVIGMPVLSSGEYKVPFQEAVKIAVASVGNALIDWKNQDEEVFEMSRLRKINFFIYDSDTQKCDEKYAFAQDIMRRYCRYFMNGKKVVFQGSYKAHVRYLNEIKLYDRKRGYFAVAKTFRWLLMVIRTLFLPCLLIKDWIAKDDWEKRRQIVEIVTFGKIAPPVLFLFVVHAMLTSGVRISQAEHWCMAVFMLVVIYTMADTLTYLLSLILLADIQRPSANIVRSIILLFVNYVEISCDLTFLYYSCYNWQQIRMRMRGAFAFGFLGESAVEINSTWMDYAFLYLGEGIKFFFLTLVLGYFFNHMRQRKFRS